MEARPAGRQPIAVSHEGTTLEEAYSGAAKKLMSSLESTLWTCERSQGSCFHPHGWCHVSVDADRYFGVGPMQDCDAVQCSNPFKMLPSSATEFARSSWCSPACSVFMERKSHVER